MTRYLETLIAQARGAEPEIRPRLRLRFEPDKPGVLEALDVENEERGNSGPMLSRPLDPIPAPQRASDDGQPRTPPVRQNAAPGSKIVRHIHDHTERVARVEHHITEHVVSHSAQEPSVGRATAPDRLAVPPLVETRSDVTNVTPIEPFHPEAKPAHMPDPVHQPAAEIPVRAAEPLAKVEQVSQSRVIGEVAAGRREVAAVSQVETIPEIVISIGTLDIRMIQDTTADHRRPLRVPERRDHGLPLADYLAKRSGGGP